MEEGYDTREREGWRRYLVIMRMPQLSLLSVQTLIKSRRDHVFDTNEARRVIGRVVDEALANLWMESDIMGRTVRGHGGRASVDKCVQ